MESNLQVVERPMPGQGVSDIAALPKDLAIIKMENDNIMALAAAHPRDYASVLADVKSQLATFKTFAQTAIYTKPVGKDPSGRMKFARGLSIRTAEAIAVAYKYNRVRCDITPFEGGAKVEATFTDYQAGRIWQDSGFISKSYKTRDGRLQQHTEDRYWNVVVKAEASKRIRECIIRCVPPGLRSELELCVNEQLDNFLDDKTVEKIVAQFSSRKVTVEMLEDLLGKRLASLDIEDRKTLLQIWNGIEQGETKVEEVFGPQNGETPPTGSRTEQVASKAKNRSKPAGATKAPKTAPEPVESPDEPENVPAGQPAASDKNAAPTGPARQASLRAAIVGQFKTKLPSEQQTFLVNWKLKGIEGIEAIEGNDLVDIMADIKGM
jgi:hypothetical protein